MQVFNGKFFTLSLGDTRLDTVPGDILLNHSLVGLDTGGQGLGLEDSVDGVLENLLKAGVDLRGLHDQLLGQGRLEAVLVLLGGRAVGLNVALVGSAEGVIKVGGEPDPLVGDGIAVDLVVRTRLPIGVPGTGKVLHRHTPQEDVQVNSLLPIGNGILDFLGIIILNILHEGNQVSHQIVFRILSGQDVLVDVANDIALGGGSEPFEVAFMATARVHLPKGTGLDLLHVGVENLLDPVLLHLLHGDVEPDGFVVEVEADIGSLLGGDTEGVEDVYVKLLAHHGGVGLFAAELERGKVEEAVVLGELELVCELSVLASRRARQVERDIANLDVFIRTEEKETWTKRHGVD